jgi:hypothetical protein
MASSVPVSFLSQQATVIKALRLSTDLRESKVGVYPNVLPFIETLFGAFRVGFDATCTSRSLTVQLPSIWLKRIERGHTCGRPEKTRQLDEQSFFAIEARIVAWFESHTIVPIQLIKSVTLN